MYEEPKEPFEVTERKFGSEGKHQGWLEKIKSIRFFPNFVEMGFHVNIYLLNCTRFNSSLKARIELKSGSGTHDRVQKKFVKKQTPLYRFKHFP